MDCIVHGVTNRMDMWTQLSDLHNKKKTLQHMVTPQIKELLLMLPSASLILSSFQVFMFTDSWPFASNRGSSKT